MHYQLRGTLCREIITPSQPAIELSALKGQCLDRRIPDMASMQAEVAAWERDRTNSAKKIVWQFTTADARIKLKRLYPKL